MPCNLLWVIYSFYFIVVYLPQKSALEDVGDLSGSCKNCYSKSTSVHTPLFKNSSNLAFPIMFVQTCLYGSKCPLICVKFDASRIIRIVQQITGYHSQGKGLHTSLERPPPALFFLWRWLSCLVIHVLFACFPLSLPQEYSLPLVTHTRPFLWMANCTTIAQAPWSYYYNGSVKAWYCTTSLTWINAGSSGSR